MKRFSRFAKTSSMQISLFAIKSKFEIKLPRKQFYSFCFSDFRTTGEFFTHMEQDFTIVGEGLQILTYAQHSIMAIEQ